MNDLLIPLAIGCAVALVSGIMVVTARRPVHAVVGLLAHSLAIAALYVILGAGFVAFGQVLIYSGAIVVLFLFVVALLPQGGVEDTWGSGHVLSSLVGAAVLLVAIAVWLVFSPGLPAAPATAPGSVADIGRVLLGRLVVAFEMTAPLLLVAIVGAVAIWRRQERTL
ncbi:MAG: NADH-quinone oxidoreductase subunit J [Chloroflexi bacterium]|nr:NADH-quinone oxidoreductase subunit J [Chloroflexota bacterium]